MGTVTHVGPREVLGYKRHYLTIELTDPDLTIMLPDEVLLSSGIRQPVSRRALKRALLVLASSPDELPVSWRERERLNGAKLAGGDVSDAAEVVRDLSARALDKRLAAHDDETLARAKHLLAGELAAAFRLTAETAAARVEAAFAQPDAAPVG